MGCGYGLYFGLVVYMLVCTVWVYKLSWYGLERRAVLYCSMLRYILMGVGFLERVQLWTVY